MGICTSIDATAVVAPLATAKLVLADGGLRELSHPVVAERALGEDARTSFICSADDLEFDGAVTALRTGEELQLGQLYFVLPRSMLGRLLHHDDMAKLAVRACSALTSSASVPTAPLFFSLAVSETKYCSENKQKARSKRSKGCRARDFSTALGTIPE